MFHLLQATYTFDPMTENCHSLRNFMFFWNTKKVRKTNLKMATKVTVVDDRSEPTILMNLNDGRDLEVWKNDCACTMYQRELLRYAVET